MKQPEGKHNPLDFEQVGLDKMITETFEPGEQIVFSWKVLKFTSKDIPIPRIIAITNLNIYNIIPADETNDVLKFFQSLVHKSGIKRKIPLSTIESVTVSQLNNEFILHIPTEYDQRYSAETQRKTILMVLCDMFCKSNFKKLSFQFTEELNLIQYTTTKQDVKRALKRTLPPNSKQMNPDELKIQSAQDFPQARSRTIFQRQKKDMAKEIGMEDFSLIKVLGRGAFGKVMLCEKKDSKEFFAIKQLKKEDIITNDHIDYIKTERKLLEQIHHPCLVSLEFAFQTDENIFFVMKFMKGGELYRHLQKLHRFSEQMALFYAAQILLALEYLHKLNVIYRDLKPENILMDETGYIALTDYGLAKFVKKGQQAQSMVGTPEYLPPEVVSQNGHDRSADWWCLGIFIYEMLCGKTPFFSENRNTMFKNICENEIKYPNNVYVSKDVKDLINQLLKKKPHDRLGAKNDGEDIKKHPWFKQISFQAILDRTIVPLYIPEMKDAQDLQNFNPEILEQDVVEDPQEKNESALKKFDDEFYGMTYAPQKL